MNYKIKDLEELRSGLNTLKETGVGYWDRDEWLKVMIKLTDDLFALHGVSSSKPSIDYNNLGFSNIDVLRETGERVFYKGKDITEDILNSDPNKPFTID